MKTDLHCDKSVFDWEKASYPALSFLQRLLQSRGGGGWLVKEGGGGGGLQEERGGRAGDGKIAADPIPHIFLLLVWDKILSQILFNQIPRTVDRWPSAYYNKILPRVVRAGPDASSPLCLHISPAVTYICVCNAQYAKAYAKESETPFWGLIMHNVKTKLFTIIP